MGQKHIVRAYDDDLNRLRALISRMGGLAETQLRNATHALAQRNDDLAQDVIATDKILDALEDETEALAIEIIALRGPMADDLREIVCALKISSVLERIGDYAKNVAKRTLVLNRAAPIGSASLIPQMSALTQTMLKDVLNAYIHRDQEKALMVWSSDNAVDELNNSMFRELLTYMMESPSQITPCAHLLFISKNIERIGDHITNMAEMVYYLAAGKRLDQDRPKSDKSSSMAVEPPL